MHPTVAETPPCPVETAAYAFDGQGEWPELQHHFYFGKARYDCNVRAVGRGGIIDQAKRTHWDRSCGDTGCDRDRYRGGIRDFGR